MFTAAAATPTPDFHLMRELTQLPNVYPIQRARRPLSHTFPVPVRAQRVSSGSHRAIHCAPGTNARSLQSSINPPGESAVSYAAHGPLPSWLRKVRSLPQSTSCAASAATPSTSGLRAVRGKAASSHLRAQPLQLCPAPNAVSESQHTPMHFYASGLIPPKTRSNAGFGAFHVEAINAWHSCGTVYGACVQSQRRSATTSRACNDTRYRFAYPLSSNGLCTRSMCQTWSVGLRIIPLDSSNISARCLHLLPPPLRIPAEYPSVDNDPFMSPLRCHLRPARRRRQTSAWSSPLPGMTPMLPHPHPPLALDRFVAQTACAAWLRTQSRQARVARRSVGCSARPPTSTDSTRLYDERLVICTQQRSLSSAAA
ncbi:hypothetical protein HYPSUDRAFT_208403 [Hypholoma sublateritium FD-334 SS-4]|uniref:Uncharacterized protein n=1 Tax=Hypholoma sublateritium (strain FD-334 SS-4) TaxID=945553 RepID=A0A0D2N6P9_HYPSF|nr:hypothetical protein HYPSUDRAFT_208403 [Hypholoma sublateritium FD-334 SS-4]